MVGLAGTFFAGRGTASHHPRGLACSSGEAADGLSDSVAPEGPVSSNFAARHDYRGRPRALVAQRGVVSADHGRCSDIGVDALREGGSAADAAVATALCQGVYNPMASGIGGGHIMLIRLPNGTAEVVDAREVAPLAANETMFVGECVARGCCVAQLPAVRLGHACAARLSARRCAPSARAVHSAG